MPTTKPNFILGVCDDASDIGVVEQMPQVNAALGHGLRFTNSFSEFPLCAPSRATAFTGLTAHNHGITGNIRQTAEEWSVTFDKTVVKELRDDGYRTVLIGVKAINGFDGTPELIGFTDWWILDEHGGDTRYFNPTIDHNGDVTQHLGYSTDILGRLAREEIARAWADGVPLYLYLAFAAPHAPASPAPEFEHASDGLGMPRTANFNELDVTDKPFFIQALPPYDARKEAKVEKGWRDRRNCMLSVDREWTAILDTVALTGGTTHAVLTSDHGFMQGNHRNTGKLLGMYDESTRVFLLWWTCVEKAWATFTPAKRKQYVSNIDVPATILDLAGLPDAIPLDGRSLFPLLTGNNLTPWRTALGIQGAWGGSADGEEVDPLKKSFCVYTRTFRYCCHAGPGIDGGLEELYDIRPDGPDGANAKQQLTNVAGRPEYATVQANLRAQAQALAKCAGQACFINGAKPVKFPRPRRK